ncbi:uncharacterized protein LOC118182711 [Stegodyphus dumicola]|uniref:uncharacterized protein LOC118182711 n=1 Tax=Stegodyphus dumicola TaxID=202533 RepID=UPI0015AC5E28|nr:uncharacterized protein LOC118182711 [Stegodyphus dumicola]
MPVAIETVIIVIVVISFAVLSAVIFALYWLWRLLLEDRRCSRLGEATSPHEWTCRPASSPEDGPQRALLGSRGRNPRITRRTEVVVDERSRRMGVKSAAYPSTRPAPPSRVAVDVHAPEVVVLDDTEPPPPYEAIGC